VRSVVRRVWCGKCTEYIWCADCVVCSVWCAECAEFGVWSVVCGVQRAECMECGVQGVEVVVCRVRFADWVAHTQAELHIHGTAVYIYTRVLNHRWAHGCW
jgi:hypothetical protein